LVLAVYVARGQDFVYDQQVSIINPPGGYSNIQPGPAGQSFVPALSSVGFVQLYLTDPSPNHTGATMYVNLWSGSLTGRTLVGQTDSISLPDVLLGSANFLFPTPPAVTPGTTYYLQPVVQSGDSFEAGILPEFLYPNGTAFFNGVASGSDLWFREGIIVPEPSTTALALFGIAGLCLHRNKFNRH
jgi:hypothetical protein